MRKKYYLKPKLNDVRIEVQQVEKPSMIIAQFNQFISKEMLELYFSNHKRSNGGDLLQVIMDNSQKCAIVVFKEYKSQLFFFLFLFFFLIE